MNKLTLPIIIGRQYKRRDGKVVTTVPCSNSTVAAVMHDNEPLPSGSVYLATGRYFSSGSESLADLVSDFNPPALTLPIVIGKRYVRRDGTVITAKPKFNGFAHGCVYVGAAEAAEQLSGAHAWFDTGRVNTSTVRDDAFDLVADYIEPEPVDAELPRGHVHAALMALYAQDAAETAEPWRLWEVIRPDVAATATVAALTDHPGWNPKFQYRRKPKTIRIGEFDVPEPLREATPDTQCFIVNLIGPDGVAPFLWSFADLQGEPAFLGQIEDGRVLLAAGLLHLTREAAELHARALLSFTSTTTGAPA